MYAYAMCGRSAAKAIYIRNARGGKFRENLSRKMQIFLKFCWPKIMNFAKKSSIFVSE